LNLYGIKIQTSIKQNLVEKYAGKSQLFQKNFWIFFGGSWPVVAAVVAYGAGGCGGGGGGGGG
jgi:hypothetical protein